MLRFTGNDDKFWEHFEDSFFFLWKETHLPYWLIKSLLCGALKASIRKNDKTTEDAISELIDDFESELRLSKIAAKITKRHSVPDYTEL